MNNSIQIARNVPTMIFEHHALRSEHWVEDIRPVQEAAENAGNTSLTAAEYLGVKPKPLEAIRQRLYEEDPPSESFLKWSALQRETQRITPPPV
jgi:predicted metallo-beta-lactamase superfamily hydrolase